MERLEAVFGDMQDIEFTVENGRLWLLQTRNGKRTPHARARIALDLLDEGLIGRDEARHRTEGLDAAQLATRRIAATDGAPPTPIARATCASDGIASGELVLDEASARARVEAGADVILVRQDAETRDIAALELARGVLTARGARTSHAAVVARQLGKVCLVGCESLRIDIARRRIALPGLELSEGEVITLDGEHGDVYRGAVRTVDVPATALLARLEALRGYGSGYAA